MSSKHVQIPEELFIALCQYFVTEPDAPDRETKAAFIRRGLENKLDRIIARKDYADKLRSRNELHHSP